MLSGRDLFGRGRALLVVSELPETCQMQKVHAKTSEGSSSPAVDEFREMWVRQKWPRAEC